MRHSAVIGKFRDVSRTNLRPQQRLAFFMGYRLGIFNDATRALGGAVTVRDFDLTTP